MIRFIFCQICTVVLHRQLNIPRKYSPSHYWSYIFAGIIVASSVHAAPGDSASSSDTTLQQHLADSLCRQADSLEARAERLERQLDTLRDSSSDFSIRLRTEINKLRKEVMAVKENVSTVLHDIFKATDLNSDTVPNKRHDCSQDLPCRTEQFGEGYVCTGKPERRQTQRSFIVSLAYTRLDIDPLERLAKNDEMLVGKKFDFSDNQMLTMGLMWYYSKDNSLRIGNGLYVGYKRFDSEIYQGVNNDSVHDAVSIPDSMIALRVIPLHFGFLCEKAIRYKYINLFAGGMIGGNLTTIVCEEKETRLMTSFIADDNFGNDDNDGRFSVAVSTAIYWDVHSGIAFSLADNVHIGVDGVVRFTYALDGFGAGFGDFLAVDPGIRVRLTFGKAG